MGRLSARRLAPIIAGVAGLGWFWAELAPQRLGFEDTDDPAVSLQFLAAEPRPGPSAAPSSRSRRSPSFRPCWPCVTGSQLRRQPMRSAEG